LSAEATVARPDNSASDAADKPQTPPDRTCLQPSTLIPADSPQVVSLAEEWSTESADAPQTAASETPQSTAAELSLEDQALRLTQRVQQEIALKPLDREVSSVKQTLRQESGDCVEHAMLLTTLLRARQIPARTASGLIINPQRPDQMLFHAWTEAWLG